MANPITPDQLIAQLKKWKVRYREFPGWRTRGRPGSFAPVGILNHHTGGSGQSDDYLHFLFVTGRPESGIPGPLCNVATAANGTLNLGATGRANHAGPGSTTVLNHVRNEDYAGYNRELEPGSDDYIGNGYLYGNEIMYTGASAPTDAAYQTAVLYAAAVADFHGWSALSAIAHREHTRRKGDPGHCPMNKFRSDLHTVLMWGPETTWVGKTPQRPTTPTPEELPLSIAEDILAKLNHHDAEEDGRYVRYEKLFAQVRLDIAADRTAVLTDNKVTRDLVGALAKAEYDRYVDLAGRVQTGNDEERERYTDYVARFSAILAAVKEHDGTVVEPPKA